VVQDIPEDDPRNPATIADNVGDNVGDVAGMGSDLFGSFAEATCAALVVAASSREIVAGGLPAICFPLYISSAGIVMCMLTSFVATNLNPVTDEASVERVLKIQLFVSTLLMTIVMYPLCHAFLPEGTVYFGGEVNAHGAVVDAIKTVDNLQVAAFVCVVCGLWGGCLIGFITEYYTSHSYTPVREVAQSCETGAATNIIYGLALGYKSAILPVIIIAAIVFAGFSLAGMYGVALSALGMLGTLATCLSIDVYGPVCDNAGGIAEMAELPEQVRDRTDALDAAGNTTAAIGKGFAIGSAALVSLALFGGFVTRAGELQAKKVELLDPITFAFLIFGAMLPYWFSALTMKSVGTAAMEMVKEVARQFDTIPGLLEGRPGAIPDHDKCIKISTESSLREMILPGLLVMVSPILTGVFFGVSAVCGLLAGGMSSGVQLAISMSNTGGAWDNAKKYVEQGKVFVNGEKQAKGSEVHKAAVTGDTVGDPLKDTSGPALNILMKLMAIISLVFAQFFMSINGGAGVFKTSVVAVTADGTANNLCTFGLSGNTTALHGRGM
jgi:inorganic pyrophosphatase